MPFAEDLSVFFSTAEFAHQATWGAQTAAVLLEQPTEDILGGRAQSNEYEVTLPTAAFPGINRNDTITIGGESYQVREKPRLVGDGALKAISVSKV